MLDFKHIEFLLSSPELYHISIDSSASSDFTTMKITILSLLLSLGVITGSTASPLEDRNIFAGMPLRPHARL